MHCVCGPLLIVLYRSDNLPWTTELTPVVVPAFTQPMANYSNDFLTLINLLLFLTETVIEMIIYTTACMGKKSIRVGQFKVHSWCNQSIY